MRKLLILLVLLLGAVAVSSPAVYSRIVGKWHSLTEWDAEARQANPIGFINHAERQLRADEQQIEETRNQLQAEIGRLAGVAREYEACGERAKRLAADVRSRYRSAAACDKFPFISRGACYSKAQAEQQIALLLGEAKAFATSLATIQRTRKHAADQLNKLALQSIKTRAELALIPGRRALLKADGISESSDQLIHQVAALLQSNKEVLEHTPVRSTEELIRSTPNDFREVDVQEFLNSTL